MHAVDSTETRKVRLCQALAQGSLSTSGPRLSLLHVQQRTSNSLSYASAASGWYAAGET